MFPTPPKLKVSGVAIGVMQSDPEVASTSVPRDNAAKALKATMQA